MKRVLILLFLLLWFVLEVDAPPLLVGAITIPFAFIAIKKGKTTSTCVVRL